MAAHCGLPYSRHVADPSPSFRFLLRVRYGECDAQAIVFNARWGEYVDVAASEYMRVLLGTADPATSGVDWRLVKQTTEWRAPAHFDDVIELRVRTIRVGTTSFVLGTEARRLADGTHLVSCETVYVVVDVPTASPPEGGCAALPKEARRSATKRPVPEALRAALDRGAPGVVVDHAGAGPVA